MRPRGLEPRISRPSTGRLCRLGQSRIELGCPAGLDPASSGATSRRVGRFSFGHRADGRVRTGDLHRGMVARYQPRYARVYVQ